ncbi:tetratricopeptide repeat protein [Chroococcidiopsis sp. TS-821]|uniref:tetratricopeptide repeat protein n=1 Tax=Chroococcidiopsis sp. TS-821 TaxID=1378066 RepID=UPI000CEF20E6|nr:tetratricopeptide repeat protein [Chroococcidiopsis sp. TS-821]PPS44210.1 hypothetical protein B1A85_09605 [Chroococcidiopsis sp. TS-821]
MGEAYRGVARRQAGDLQAALVDYHMAIQLAPNYAIAYYDRGVLYDELGDKQKAIADYTRAIQLNPNYAEAYYYRGIIRYKLNDKHALSDLFTAKNLLIKQGKLDLYQQAVEIIKSIE